MYDLDDKPPGWVPTWFDQMSEPNGVQTNAMLARISWRTAAAAGDRPTIHAEEETPIAVKETERGSTRFTAIGSLFAWSILVVFAASILKAFATDAPSINEQSLDVKPEFVEPFPDFAVAINIANWTEAQTLEYLWPMFKWESIRGGFENRIDQETLLDEDDGLRFGDACALKAGYSWKENGRWPVFCFLNSQLPPKKQYMLRGRAFGDPFW